MRITPISTSAIYRPTLYRPIKKTKTASISNSKKAAKTTKLKDDGILLFDAPEFDGEDPDSAFDTWINNFQQIDPTASELESDFLKDLILETKQIFKLYNNHSKIDGFNKNTATHSFQHLTLPEALIYHDLLDKKDAPTNQTFSFKTEKLVSKDTISLTMHNKKNKNKTHYLTIHYRLINPIAEIWAKTDCVGHAKYIIRNQKLEEIEGLYRKNKLLLDPVWSQNKSISYERIKLGKLKTDIIRNQTKKNAMWVPSTGSVINMKVSTIKSHKIDSQTFMTIKSTTLGPYQIKTKLIFFKNILMPIGGKISIS
jgi:hypothetical protein